MAVGAHDGAHFLAREGLPILALRFQGFIERGIGDDQAHGVGFMAIRASDRLGDLFGKLREFERIILAHAHFGPQLGIVGTLA